MKRVDLLLTHLHMDHIQGLGFFAPLYTPGLDVHLWGPPSTTRTLRSRLNRYLSPPLFPVRIRELPSRVHCHDVTQGQWEIGDFKVRSSLVAHPDPTLGYRLESEGRIVTYLPDHEPQLGCRTGLPTTEWLSGHHLAEGADLLIHDAQYTEDEYLNRVGWGTAPPPSPCVSPSSCAPGAFCSSTTTRPAATSRWSASALRPAAPTSRGCW
ncbi:MAG: MBL fold metallo-hydrolase [Deltaproteobacteria bacterium]|nr:MBL fold metallo-hydrolase [Deltaproteobacteria bacterium]